MAKRKKIRRFLVTVEEVEIEIEPDQLEIAHQKPPRVQTRGAGKSWWITAQEKRERAIAAKRERARQKAEERENCEN